MERLELTGQTFGKWYVESRAENSPEGRTMWNCICECGTRRTVMGKTLKNGASKCCGCTRKENAIIGTKKANTTHGMKKTRLYSIWQGMKGRCRYPSTNDYEIYGGRGISVCEEWEEFEPFMIWALSNGYEDHLTIDRIDPDGNYEPSNCRWATWSEQARNKRNKLKGGESSE